MKQEQALQVIKGLIDQAIKAGLVNNMNEAQLILQAFYTLQPNNGQQ